MSKKFEHVFRNGPLSAEEIGRDSDVRRKVQAEFPRASRSERASGGSAMCWRRSELSEFGNQIVWLNQFEAATIHTNAMNWMSQSCYGLNPTIVGGIERINVDKDELGATTW